MNRTARRIATSAAATAVTVAMAAPAAVAHDRHGSYDGDRDGYSSRHDGDRDGYDGDRDGYDGDRDGRDGFRERHEGDGDRWDGDRQRWDGDHAEGADRDDDDGYKSDRRDLGDKKVVRHGRWATLREGHKEGKRGFEVSFAQQKRAMLTYLDRADAFLAELSNRVSGSELDPTLKSTLLGVIANRQATIANLRQQVQAASTPEDLRALRHSADADGHH